MSLTKVPADRNPQLEWPIEVTPLTPTLPYKVYVALLNQESVDDPVETEMVNTIGTLAWARTTNGTYTLTSAGLFTANKTWLMLNVNNNLLPTNAQFPFVVEYTSTNVITIKTYGGGVLNDGILVDTAIEVRVFE